MVVVTVAGGPEAGGLEAEGKEARPLLPRGVAVHPSRFLGRLRRARPAPLRMGRAARRSRLYPADSRSLVALSVAGRGSRFMGRRECARCVALIVCADWFWWLGTMVADILRRMALGSATAAFRTTTTRLHGDPGTGTGLRTTTLVRWVQSRRPSPQILISY